MIEHLDIEILQPLMILFIKKVGWGIDNDQAIFLNTGIKGGCITFLHGNNLSMKNHDNIWEYQFTPVIDTLSSYPAITFGGGHTFLGAEKGIRNRKSTISISSHSQQMRRCYGPLST